MDKMAIFGAVTSALFALSRSFALVKTGRIGVLTTWDKVRRTKDGQVKLIYPGFKLYFPFVQKILSAPLYKQTQNMREQSITLGNGLSYKFNAYMQYRLDGSSPDAVERFLCMVEDTALAV